MAPAVVKKRKVLDSLKTSRPKKKFRKQAAYHSSSEDEDEGDFQPVDLADSDVEGGSPLKEQKVGTSQESSKPTKTTKSLGESASESDESGASGSSDEDEEDEENDEFSDVEVSSDDGNSDAGSRKKRQTSKRNDPTAFSTSISKILSTKLPSSARADPVLSRSRNATQTATELSNERLEQRARAKLRAEKKEELDRGRIRDVLGVERGEAGETAEEERRLRKIAQRGVVKLFNAVRAAQVRGEEAARAERQKGTIGMGEREKAVNEVSKQGFLELINGKKGKGLNIEEA
ncbi:pre-60S ribosomal particles component [Paecilomyces lecythidis]|uniref:Pre-60S ribosomal particles component n=1 Tax=Paecilomyces lecythidis TaxID=3004212 RepID=A0ABR3XTU8_9EURO